MWIVIIVIVVFIIGKFLLDKNEQAGKITMQGGMKNKYKELIEYLMSGDMRTRIFEETSDSLTLGLSNAGGSTLFVLIQSFGKVTVQWKLNSPIYGKHKLEWSFDEFKDQEEMADVIFNNIAKYDKNLMETFGF